MTFRVRVPLGGVALGGPKQTGGGGGRTVLIWASMIPATPRIRSDTQDDGERHRGRGLRSADASAVQVCTRSERPKLLLTCGGMVAARSTGRSLPQEGAKAEDLNRFVASQSRLWP